MKTDGAHRTYASYKSLTPEQQTYAYDLGRSAAVKDGKLRVGTKTIEGGAVTAAGKSAANGAFYAASGDIYIDINAGNFGEGLMMYTLAHEYTHFIRHYSRESFNRLADFAVDRMYETGTDINDLISAQMRKNSDLSFDEAYEETIADAMEEMLTGEAAVKHLQAMYEADRGLMAKFKEVLRKMWLAFKNVAEQYKNIDENKLTAAAKAVRKFSTETRDELGKLYVEALKVAAGEYKGLDTKVEKAKPATEGGNSGFIFQGAKKVELTSADIPAVSGSQGTAISSTNNSIYNSSEKSNTNPKKISEPAKKSARDYSYEALTSKPDMEITQLTERVPLLSNGKINRADTVVQAILNCKNFGTITKNAEAIVKVKDTGTDVVISKTTLRHGMDRRVSVQAPVILQIGEILSNAIKINELMPREDKVNETYMLVSIAKNTDNEPYVVTFVVNSYINEMSSMDVLYAANVKRRTENKKTESAGLVDPELQANALQSLTDSTISISNLLDFVNRYFPDILPEDVLRHYGHTSRPAGKLGESALFSTRDPDAISNRELLANALDTAARNDIEKKHLSQYRERIDYLDAQEAHLREVNAEIKKLSFASGARDNARLKALKDDAIMTRNRIYNADKGLLRVEAAFPLKNILDSERAARRKAEKAVDRAQTVAAKREAKLNETIDYQREMRKKGIDSRDRTRLRNKVKGIVGELNHLLLHGSKDNHIRTFLYL